MTSTAQNPGIDTRTVAPPIDDAETRPMKTLAVIYRTWGITSGAGGWIQPPVSGFFVLPHDAVAEVYSRGRGGLYRDEEDV